MCHHFDNRRSYSLWNVQARKYTCAGQCGMGCLMRTASPLRRQATVSAMVT